MTETLKDKLAEAEFWTFEAKNYAERGTGEWAKLEEAHRLIREAMKAYAEKGWEPR